MNNFTAMELDALREICGIASGRAAGSLSKMLGATINLSVPKLWVTPVSQVPVTMGEPEAIVAGVYFQLVGDVSGGILITFPHKSIRHLLANLINQPQIKEPFSDLARSAIMEVGNIVVGSFVNTFSTIIGKSLIISIPKLAIDMAGAIIDSILIELANEVEDALVLEINFSDVPNTVKGHFYIMPNRGSLEIMMEAIKIGKA